MAARRRRPDEATLAESAPAAYSSPAFQHDPRRWREFAARYRAELRAVLVRARAGGRAPQGRRSSRAPYSGP